MEINISQGSPTEATVLNNQSTKKTKVADFAEVLASLQLVEPAELSEVPLTVVEKVPSTLGEEVVEEEEAREAQVLPGTLQNLGNQVEVKLEPTNSTDFKSVPAIKVSEPVNVELKLTRGTTPLLEQLAPVAEQRESGNPNLNSAVETVDIVKSDFISSKKVDNLFADSFPQTELVKNVQLEIDVEQQTTLTTMESEKNQSPQLRVSHSAAKIDELPPQFSTQHTTESTKAEIVAGEVLTKNSGNLGGKKMAHQVVSGEEQEATTSPISQGETAVQHTQLEQPSQRLAPDFSTTVVRSAAPPTLSKITISQVEEVLQGTPLTSGDIKVVKLQLEPAQLGEVEITLELFNGEVKGKLVVANQQVKELFEKSLPMLELSGNKQSVSLNNLQVEVQHELSSAMSFSQQYQQPQHQGGQRSKTFKSGSEYGKQSFKETQQTTEVNADRVDLLV